MFQDSAGRGKHRGTEITEKGRRPRPDWTETPQRGPWTSANGNLTIGRFRGGASESGTPHQFASRRHRGDDGSRRTWLRPPWAGPWRPTGPASDPASQRHGLRIDRSGRFLLVQRLRPSGWIRDGFCVGQNAARIAASAFGAARLSRAFHSGIGSRQHARRGSHSRQGTNSFPPRILRRSMTGLRLKP